MWFIHSQQKYDAHDSTFQQWKNSEENIFKTLILTEMQENKLLEIFVLQNRYHMSRIETTRHIKKLSELFLLKWCMCWVRGSRFDEPLILPTFNFWWPPPHPHIQILHSFQKEIVNMFLPPPSAQYFKILQTHPSVLFKWSGPLIYHNTCILC